MPAIPPRENPPGRFFVFVAVGKASHLATLETSLALLSRFSRVPALVVTDPARNERPVAHDRVIEVATPENLSNKGAAVFLKTSLHRHVPEGGRYCYIDTDVLAVRPGVDAVFEQQARPVAFAPDHCSIRCFSPYAVRCGCLETSEKEAAWLKKLIRNAIGCKLPVAVWESRLRELNRLISQWQSMQFTDSTLQSEQRELFSLISRYHEGLARFQSREDSKRLARIEHVRSLLAFLGPLPGISGAVKNSLLKAAPLYVGGGLRPDKMGDLWQDRTGRPYYQAQSHNFSRFFQKDGRFVWDGQRKQWFNREGRLVCDDETHNLERFLKADGRFVFHAPSSSWRDRDGNTISQETTRYQEAIESSSPFVWDAERHAWLNPSGRAVFEFQCDHLMEAVQEKFGVPVTNPEWVHPNGGVFLFDRLAEPFLDRWHEYAMEVLDDPGWEDRDQGALVAALWASGLQDSPRLPLRFNYIVDFYATDQVYGGDMRFARLGEEEVAPVFVHIYHELGNREWAVWQDVEKLLSGEA